MSQHPYSTPPSPARSAYIHVPFCRHRCGYCNFTVIAGRDDLIDAYLNALECELSWLDSPRPVDTLFLGGGTPTHLSPIALARLLSIATRWFPLSATGPATERGEFSVEANPADVTAEKIDLLAQHGVTRLSLGAQSFNSAKLALLERDHDAGRIAAAVSTAKARLASVSLDLIFAASGESAGAWRADLDAAVALAPDHISTYGLTFEKGTNYWRRRESGDLNEVDEEPQRDMYVAALDTLAAAGYEHYEVSNFARPGHRCRHNEAYWRGDEYYAAGPGASRYLAGRRETNHRSTTTYLARVLAGNSPVAEVDELSPVDRARERLVFALRRTAGVNRAWFAAASGYEVDALAAATLARYRDLGLVADDGDTIRVTREGLLVSDALWPPLLAP